MLQTELHRLTLLLLPFHVPYVFVWGVVAGLLSFVPYVGVPLAIIPPLLVAWLNGSSLTEVSLLLGLYLIFRTTFGHDALPKRRR